MPFWTPCRCHLTFFFRTASSWPRQRPKHNKSTKPPTMSSIFSRGAANANRSTNVSQAIARQIRRKQRECPSCGSTKWIRDPVSGRVTCGNHHVRRGWRDEAADEDGGMAMGGGGRALPTTARRHTQRLDRRTRAGNRVLAKRVARIAKYNPDRSHYLSPAHATFRVAQACQALLRVQLSAIQRIWPHVPHVRIQTVARDLWASVLADAQRPPTKDSARGTLVPAPYFAHNIWYGISSHWLPVEQQRERERARSRSRSRSAAPTTDEVGGYTSAGSQMSDAGRTPAPYHPPRTPIRDVNPFPIETGAAGGSSDSGLSESDHSGSNRSTKRSTKREPGRLHHR